MILYIQHEVVEGPEKIGDFFEQRGYQQKCIILPQGDCLPDSFENIDAVVSLGGPMNVDEEEQHLYLAKENIFIKQLLEKKIPFLGVCLGAQLLAKAAGAKVVKSPKPEIGFFDVTLTTEGKQDFLFKGVDEKFEVFQWHGDMFQIPLQGKLLATSQLCPHQVLRVGECAYGIQFHVEVRERNIREWAEVYWKKRGENYQQEVERMVDEYREKVHNLDNLAGKILKNFVNLIENHKNKTVFN